MFKCEAHTESESDSGSGSELRGSPSLVGRGIANPQEHFLAADFESYLRAQNKRNIKQIMSYAQRYHGVLETGDATPVVKLSSASRRHAMEALAILSKYYGIYDKWQQIRKRYSLKWTDGNESLQSLQRFFSDDFLLDNMLQRINEMIQNMPLWIGRIIKFACLVGLRPSEVIESVRLINNKDTFAKYYNP